MAEIERDTRAAYRHANQIRIIGFIIKAVLAGRETRAEAHLLLDLPVQMCHFHQKLIITRYLTRRPNFEAGKEIREVVHGLVKSTEECFVR